SANKPEKRGKLRQCLNRRWLAHPPVIPLLSRNRLRSLRRADSHAATAGITFWIPNRSGARIIPPCFRLAVVLLDRQVPSHFVFHFVEFAWGTLDRLRCSATPKAHFVFHFIEPPRGLWIASVRRSAGFPTCRIADFLIGSASVSQRSRNAV